MYHRALTRALGAATLAAALLLAGCGRADAPTGQAGATPQPSAPPAAGQGGLAGTKWILASYGPSGSATAVPAGAGVTAEIGDDGRLGGSSGCNSYSAPFTLDSQAISVGEIQQTDRACVDQGAMARERAFLSALHAATSYTLAGDTLTIAYDGGELRFTRLQPAPDRPLEGTAWELTTFVTGDVASSLISGTQVTAEFKDGKLGGTAGCNHYFGGYSLSGQALTVSEVGATKMVCDGGIMRQEQQFLSALQAATSFTIAGDQLTIAHPGGSLVFSAGAP
jgi:heat shock protein HslJ